MYLGFQRDKLHIGKGKASLKHGSFWTLTKFYRLPTIISLCKWNNRQKICQNLIYLSHCQTIEKERKNALFNNQLTHIKIRLPTKSSSASISHRRGESMSILHLIRNTIRFFFNHNHLTTFSNCYILAQCPR